MPHALIARAREMASNSKPWPIYASSSKAFYIESLNEVQRAAYRDKLTLIDGLDPYTVSKDALVYDVEALPKITHHDIINCLVFNPSRFTMEDMKDCKSLEAYDMFFRGWVRDLGVIQVKEDTCVLRALVSVQADELSCRPALWYCHSTSSVYLSL